MLRIPKRTVRWLRSNKRPSARNNGFGSDNVCPGHRTTLSANRKTGYERTTIGNQLRAFNRTPTGVWTSAPDYPGAVVVYADATGGGSRLGLEAGTICRHRTGLCALARHESNQPLIRMPLPDGRLDRYVGVLGIEIVGPRTAPKSPAPLPNVAHPAVPSQKRLCLPTRFACIGVHSRLT